jgi:type I restriction enzyme M protein
LSRRQELISQFKNPEHEYYLDPADFGGADSAEYQAEINTELEQRDYYSETNVF